MASTRLVAIVVTFNRLEKLKDTVAALLAASRNAPLEILVFDNASTDGTVEWLDGLFEPALSVVKSQQNLGGAGGFEQAMRAAQRVHDPEWVVLMDDDARPRPGTLERFLATDRTHCDGWAAAVTYPDGTVCDMNRPWVNPFGSFWAFVRTVVKRRNGFHLNADAILGKGTVPIDGGSFVGLFLHRSAIDRAGFPDGRLFLYGDDVLYTLALSSSGGKLAFDPTLHFEHDCETLNPDATLTPLWKVYFYHRNQVLVYRKAAGPIMFWPIFWLRRRQWRKRADAYGALRIPYLRLLEMAMSDGLSRQLDRSLDEVRAISDER